MYKSLEDSSQPNQQPQPPAASHHAVVVCGNNNNPKLELVVTALIVALLVVFQFVYLLPQAIRQVVLASPSATTATGNQQHHPALVVDRARRSILDTGIRNSTARPVEQKSNNLVPSTSTKSSESGSRSKTKILAAANGELWYKNMAILWYHRMTDLGYTTHELLALDDVAAQAFAEHGLRHARLHLCRNPDTDSKKKYRTHLFAMRWHYIQEQLAQGYHILLTDVDNYFMSYKPMSDMEQLHDIDVVHAFSGNFPQNMIKSKGWAVCGGMIWVRASPGGKRMVQHMLQDCGASHGDTCALQCDDQRVINNIYLNNVRNFTFTMKGQNADDIPAADMAQNFWKPPLTGRSPSFYNFTTWDVHTAYRGPEPPPDKKCPRNNWVAMPYAGRDRVAAMHKFRKLCDPHWGEIENELKVLEDGKQKRDKNKQHDKKDKEKKVLEERQDKSTSVVSTSLETNQQGFNKLQCLREVLDNLPIGTGRLRKFKQIKEDKVFAHHYDAANRKKWNAAIRFKPMEQMKDTAKCSFWEVGAHVKAADSRDMLKKYPKCKYHAYEPVPDFYRQLSKNWEGVESMTVHNYGLAAKDSVMHLSADALQGEATFIGDQENGSIPAQIRSFEHAVADAGGVYPTVMHFNCEGCEWTALPDLADSGFAQHVSVLQISMHNYGGGGLGNRVWEYCEIREKLLKTHNLVEGIPFAWERWELRQGNNVEVL